MRGIGRRGSLEDGGIVSFVCPFHLLTKILTGLWEHRLKLSRVMLRSLPFSHIDHYTSTLHVLKS